MKSNYSEDNGVPIPFIIIFIALVLAAFGVLITKQESKPKPPQISYDELIGKNIMWNGHKTFVVGYGVLGGYKVVITQDNGNAITTTASMDPLVNAYRETLSMEKL
jgi:hypothetical protein